MDFLSAVMIYKLNHNYKPRNEITPIVFRQIGNFQYEAADMIFSVFNGLVFILLVTRHLTQHDFGLWQLILSIITYSALPNVVVDYWAIRDIARGQRVAT